MIGVLKLIGSDFLGLSRTCGWGVALRWLTKVAITFPQCRRAHNLQPADRVMGEGPFTCRLGRARARLVGSQVISGIREIWVRDVYLSDGFLSIPDNALVVDLGANMGNFTLLALGHGPGVRVVSVEANPQEVARLRRSLAENGWTDRAKVCECFLGGKTEYQEHLIRDEGSGGVPFVSQEDFVRDLGPGTIDLLKCDIEGSEFGLLTPDSPLLARTRQIAIEIHDNAGDRHQFMRMLRDMGFELRERTNVAGVCVVVIGRRSLPMHAGSNEARRTSGSHRSELQGAPSA